MNTLTQEELAISIRQYLYCEKKRAEARTPRDTAKTLIRPYVLHEGWTLEELLNSNMGNGNVQIGGYAFEENEQGHILKMHDVPRGRIAVTKNNKPCGYVTFSLAELYAEVQQEIDIPQQLVLF
jgi:hypothetical protein